MGVGPQVDPVYDVIIVGAGAAGRRSGQRCSRRQAPLDEAARDELRTFIDEAMAEYRQFTTGGALGADSDDLKGCYDEAARVATVVAARAAEIGAAAS